MRTVEYLSPSSLSEFESCPYRFFRKRMCDDRVARSPQSDAMGFGTLFDAQVKAHIASHLGIRKPSAWYENLLRNVEPQNMQYEDQARNLGHLYIESGRIQELMKDGLSDVELEEKKEVWGVPVLGKPDAMFETKEPFDWKVTGFFAAKPPSPKKGYFENIALKTGIRLGPSPSVGIPFEEVDESWATQLTIYHWLLFKPIIIPFVANIDQVYYSGSKGPMVAVHKGVVSVEFQEQLRDRLIKAWNQINNWDGAEFVAKPSKFRCEAFGNLCDVAKDDKCSVYSESLGDPITRMILEA